MSISFYMKDVLDTEISFGKKEFSLRINSSFFESAFQCISVKELLTAMHAGIGSATSYDADILAQKFGFHRFLYDFLLERPWHCPEIAIHCTSRRCKKSQKSSACSKGKLVKKNYRRLDVNILIDYRGTLSDANAHWWLHHTARGAVASHKLMSP